MTEDKIRRLMHLLCTLQVVNDEISHLPAELNRTNYRQQLKQETKLYEQATRRYLRALCEPNTVLVQIWENVPIEDMDAFISVKTDLIKRMQYATFEEVNEMHAHLTDAGRKLAMLDIIEDILEKFLSRQMRDVYREKMGYTLEQYQALKQMK